MAKLKRQVDYVQALEEGDLVSMKRIEQDHIHIEDTPKQHFQDTPDSTYLPIQKNHSIQTDHLRLDDFMATYKSEDTHSFSKIIQQQNRERLEKYKWMVEYHLNLV